MLLFNSFSKVNITLNNRYETFHKKLEITNKFFQQLFIYFFKNKHLLHLSKLIKV